MSELLQKYHASNSVNQQRIVTLEFAHSAIVPAASPSNIIFNVGYLRLAQSFTTFSAAIDESSPPATAFYNKAGFGFDFPSRGATGRQELNFQIDNVSRDAWSILRAIKVASRTSAERCIITMRIFLASDLNTIQDSYTFTAKRFEMTRQSVMVTGVFHELVNRRAPKRLYLPSDYPGLKYI